MATNPIFWGKAGSGILFLADDDTVLLTLRSPHVMQPNTWGIPGGAITGTEGHHKSEGKRKFKFTYQAAWESAMREANEELGYFPARFKVIGRTEFQEGNFVYVTYIVQVWQDEKRYITENSQPDPHEVSQIAWVPLRRLINYRNDKLLAASLHFGLKFTLDKMAER